MPEVAWTNVLDIYLNEILGHPGKDEDGLDQGLWGSCESYELQVLLLLELRFFPCDRHAMMDCYHRFINPSFPDKGCRPLSALRRLRVNELARRFSAFRQELELERP